MSEKLDRVKATLVREHRFFATLLMSREWKEDPKLEALGCTDGRSITINPVMCEQYPEDELVGFLCHELAHIYGKHHLRRNNREWETWSESSDYAINPSLINLGLKLPPTKFLRMDFEGKCVEEIFNILLKEKEEQEENPDKSKSQDGGRKKAPEGGFDYVEDEKAEDGSPLSEAEKSMQEMEMNITINQAARIAKQAGKFPAELEQLFDTLKKVETNWTEELREYVQVQAKNDYTWAYPNRRYIHQGLYLPSLRSMEIGTIGIIIDVSGSITSYMDLLSQFMTQVKLLLEELKTTATVLLVDTTIKDVFEEVTSEEIDNIKITGGGGTDFIPGFAWFEERGEPDIVIYFTDLRCSSFPLEPMYPVLWCTYGGEKYNPPFGKVIHMK